MIVMKNTLSTLIFQKKIWKTSYSVKGLDTKKIKKIKSESGRKSPLERIGWMAEWLCKGLQILVRRFDSGPSLQPKELEKEYENNNK